MNLDVKHKRKPGEEGIFLISNEEYHSSDGVSSTTLKLLLDHTPRDLKAMKEKPHEPSKAMNFGTAFHTWMLEPEKLESEIALIKEPINRRTKEGKAKWEELTKKKIVIQGDELELLNQMTMHLSQHKKWPIIMTGAEVELSFYKKINGVMCKARPDILRENLIGDLKTFVDILTDANISREIAKRHYHFSAAMYLRIVGELIPAFPANFVWVFSSKAGANLARFVKASSMDLQTGVREFERCLEQYKKCEETGVWPGYQEDDVQAVELPGWYNEYLGPDCEALRVKRSMPKGRDYARNMYYYWQKEFSY